MRIMPYRTIENAIDGVLLLSLYYQTKGGGGETEGEVIDK